MDNRENLRSMLNNLINDKPEEAGLDLRNYLTVKMRGVAGIGSTDAADDVGVIADDDAGDDKDTDDNRS